MAEGLESALAVHVARDFPADVVGAARRRSWRNFRCSAGSSSPSVILADHDPNGAGGKSGAGTVESALASRRAARLVCLMAPSSPATLNDVSPWGSALMDRETPEEYSGEGWRAAAPEAPAAGARRRRPVRPRIARRPLVAAMDMAGSMDPMLQPAHSSSGIVNPADWEGEAVPPREWIVSDAVPDKTVSLLTGDGAGGKSLLSLQLGAARALGKAWIRLLTEPGRTLILSA